MRDATDVPKLQEDLPALVVDGTHHALPAFDLGRRVDARRRGRPLAGGQYLARLGDDQAAGGGALAVVAGIEFIGNVARPGGAHPGQRRHHDAVRQRERAELEGVEERSAGHPEILSWRLGWPTTYPTPPARAEGGTTQRMRHGGLRLRSCLRAERGADRLL